MHMFVLCNCWCVLKVEKFGIEVLFENFVFVYYYYLMFYMFR